MAKDSSHGTRQRYRSGCGCEACRKAASEDVLRRRKYTLAARKQRASAQRLFHSRNRNEARAYQRRYRNSPRGKAMRAMHRERRRAASFTKTGRIYAEVLLGDRCAYCNAAVEVVDHIHPIALGGDGEFTNLTAACRACNSRKYAKPLLEFLLERFDRQYEKG